eukprot:scaffold44193_cov76-Phaeocystis_antarctica.AAC.2
MRGNLQVGTREEAPPPERELGQTESFGRQVGRNVDWAAFIARVQPLQEVHCNRPHRHTVWSARRRLRRVESLTQPKVDRVVRAIGTRSIAAQVERSCEQLLDLVGQFGSVGEERTRLAKAMVFDCTARRLAAAALALGSLKHIAVTRVQRRTSQVLQ